MPIISSLLVSRTMPGASELFDIWWMFAEWKSDDPTLNFHIYLLTWSFHVAVPTGGHVYPALNEKNIFFSVFLSQWLNCPINSLGHSSGS